MGKPFPKEDELLGRGVSYCATCDAHFYPGKTVAVLGYNAESCREANFLAETAGRLLYFPVVPHEVAVNDHVQVINERPIAILKYVENGYSQFDCPGHQGGAFFRKHPAGRAFYDFFGENT